MSVMVYSAATFGKFLLVLEISHTAQKTTLNTYHTSHQISLPLLLHLLTELFVPIALLRDVVMFSLVILKQGLLVMFHGNLKRNIGQIRHGSRKRD